MSRPYTRRALFAVLVLGVLAVAAAAFASSGYFARLFVDGVEVASQELDPGVRDVRVVVDGPAGTLLDESFQVDVPEHVVIDSDTLIENETLTLRAGDSIEFRNGARLMFGEGASADWQGTPTATWSDDGATQNLDRDIDVFGSGDIMFMAGSEPSIIRYVEIDLQPLTEPDHYPLHWHKVGDGSRGTLVEGVVVKNSTQRAFVPHASHGITFRDTIAKNIAGPAYWWNPPPFQSTDTTNNSNDVLYDHVLADGITNDPGDDRGTRLAAFVLGAGTGNTVRDSVAMNVNPSHPKNCAGFNWPELNVDQPSVWTFENNKTFDSACNGVFVWQNDSEIHFVDGFASTEPIEHGAYNNRYQYRNADVPGVIVHATGWGMDGGSVGDVITRRHRTEGSVTFENLTVDSFTISNAGNGGDVPAHYVFDGTTLDCVDVAWADVVADTTVTIDGEPCIEGVDPVAFPSVRSSNSGTTTGTSHSVPMPASITAGDLLLIVGEINVTAPTPSTPSGWTLLVGAQDKLYAYVKVAAGSDTATVPTNIACGIAWTTMSIQDWEGTLSGVEALSNNGANSADPPSLSPSWGSADTLWIEIVGTRAGTTPAVSAWSTSYTEIGQVTGDFSTDVMAGAAYRQNATATENPNSITITGSPTQTNVATIAVEPGAGAATQNLTGTTFQKAPTFNTGTVSAGAVNLAGTTFQKAPTFGTGTVAAGAVNLAGSTYQLAPTFPQGTVSAGDLALTGTTFTKAPTFPQGTIEGTYALTGTTFEKAPTFPLGAVAVGSVNLAGSTFQLAPTFPTGTVTSPGTTFWSKDPVGFTKNAVGFTKVGPDDASPW